MTINVYCIAIIIVFEVRNQTSLIRCHLYVCLEHNKTLKNIKVAANEAILCMNHFSSTNAANVANKVVPTYY